MLVIGTNNKKEEKDNFLTIWSLKNKIWEKQIGLKHEMID